MRRPAAAAAQGKVFFWRWGRPGRRGSSVIDYITCTENTVFIFHNVDVNCKLQHPNTSKTSFTPSHMCYSQELKDTQRRTRVPSRDKEWQDPGAKERQALRHTRHASRTPRVLATLDTRPPRALATLAQNHPRVPATPECACTGDPLTPGEW